MAVISNSNQYTKQISVLRAGEPGEQKSLHFDGVTASAATGEINFIKLPPGKLKIQAALSSVIMANGAATANLAVGTGAYTASNGAAVAAAPAAIQAARLVNAHVVATSNLVPVNAGVLVDSLSGVTIYGTISTANTAANGAYEGYITFTYLG